MPSTDVQQSQPIGVGAVGVVPEAQEGLLAELPPDAGFELVAFSDEGLPEQGPEERPFQYYPDYNMLLQDPHVELVLVDGPLELRRDMAVRALNAGRHVVLPLPFAETAPGGERIMKTALSGQGLVATADCWWRDDADLLALRAALDAADAGPVHGLFFFTALEPRPPADDVLTDLLMPQDEVDLEEEEAIEAGLLGDYGVEVLDQLHLVAGDYVKSVNAHLIAPPLPGVSPDAAEGFMTYLSLRGGGWAVAQATTHQAPDLPRWAVYTARATVTARDGIATVTTADGTETYTPAVPHRELLGEPLRRHPRGRGAEVLAGRDSARHEAARGGHRVPRRGRADHDLTGGCHASLRLLSTVRFARKSTPRPPLAFCTRSPLISSVYVPRETWEGEMAKKQRLGRGLDSLIPDMPELEPQAPRAPQEQADAPAAGVQADSAAEDRAEPQAAAPAGRPAGVGAPLGLHSRIRRHSARCRAPARGRLRAGRRRAAPARHAHGRPGEHSGHHPRHSGRQDARDRPRREHPARRPERDREGEGHRPHDRGARPDPGRGRAAPRAGALHRHEPAAPAGAVRRAAADGFTWNIVGRTRAGAAERRGLRRAACAWPG